MTHDEGEIAISVIMPSFNSGTYIVEALQSALLQDPHPHEIIVQDGGSTDSTLEVLKSFGDVVDWRSEPDRGQSEALNRAIERATGNILIWLNADDVLVPGAFAAARKAFLARPDAEFAYGDFDMMDAGGTILRKYRSSTYDPARVFTHGCYIFSGTMFLSRRLVERVGRYDERLHACMDFDFLLRIGPAQAVHAGATIARFRMSGEGKSSTIRKQFLRESHALRWKAAGKSIRLRAMTLALDLHDAFSLWTRPLRLTKVWSAARREKTL